MEHDSICYICKPKNPLSPADNRKERISLYFMKLKKDAMRKPAFTGYLSHASLGWHLHISSVDAYCRCLPYHDATLLIVLFHSKNTAILMSNSASILVLLTKIIICIEYYTAGYFSWQLMLGHLHYLRFESPLSSGHKCRHDQT